jgi:hypothetical protein
MKGTQVSFGRLVPITDLFLTSINPAGRIGERARQPESRGSKSNGTSSRRSQFLFPLIYVNPQAVSFA